MMISIAPIVASFLNANSVYNVIMQTEIDEDGSQEVIKIKKELAKEFCHSTCILTFVDFADLATVKLLALNVKAHCQTFYPTVPTPPPNA